jgi:hypothetical protein
MDVHLEVRSIVVKMVLPDQPVTDTFTYILHGVFIGVGAYI